MPEQTRRSSHTCTSRSEQRCCISPFVLLKGIGLFVFPIPYLSSYVWPNMFHHTSEMARKFLIPSKDVIGIG